MALQVICPHCSHPNSVGKVFCGACGGNMQSASKPPKIISDGPSGSAPVRLVSFLFKMALILAPIALLIFMLNPTPSAGKAGRRSQSREYDDALKRVAAASKGTEPFVMRFSEEWLNAKLAHEISKQPAVTGYGFAIKGLNIDLIENKDDLAKGTIRVTLLTVMKDKLRLSYQLDVAPRVGEDGLTFDVISGSIGQVAAPLNLKKILVANRIASIFQESKEEREVLDRVKLAQIKEDVIALQILPNAKRTP